MLTGKDYLIGDRLTEADVRLFVTLVRSAALSGVRLPDDTLDPLRPRVRRPLQMQHPHDPWWFSNPAAGAIVCTALTIFPACVLITLG